MFAAAGILHPIGSGFLQSVPELVRAIAHLQEKCPELQQVVIKLNEAFSGEGNAVLDLRPLRPFSSLHAPDHLQRIENSPEEMAFQAPNETWVSYRQRFNTLDGIVEAFVAGNVKQSPSVQGCITPKGSVEIVSTHEPLLKPFIAKPSAFSILRCPPLA
ncbi:hypothetical protein [uncultured Thermosynechococcus sp.]|uniref:hypothetical protein n=1 Tax=uncultured Thermosynechococcus sp. TaxID=436945 RepID=UPI0026018EEA|nr:hypothetical protein [uncultured Thermosynechococcus sp.]